MPAKGWWAGEVSCSFIRQRRRLRRCSHARALGAQQNAAPAEPPPCRSHPDCKPRGQRPPRSTSLPQAQAAGRGFALAAWGFLAMPMPTQCGGLVRQLPIDTKRAWPCGGVACQWECLPLPRQKARGIPEGGLYLRPFLCSIEAQGPLCQKSAGAGAARRVCRCDSYTHGPPSPRRM